jgi:hypothetical protein
MNNNNSIQIMMKASSLFNFSEELCNRNLPDRTYRLNDMSDMGISQTKLTILYFVSAGGCI